MCSSPQATAQSGIQLAKLNYFEIRTTDPERSKNFYQSLFGLPVQTGSDGRTVLQIGNEQQYMAIRAVADGESPGISQLGYSVSNYDLESTQAALIAGGFREIDVPDIAEQGINIPLTTWVRMRGNTPVLYFSDARGLIVQLTDTTWCSGNGSLGNQCVGTEAMSPGLLSLDEINHFTSFVNDGAGANLFYQDFFGLDIQAYQGPNSPVTGIGDGKQFVMYAGPFPGGENAPANIHHASFNMTGFTVDGVLTRLEEQGISARGQRQTGPMMHYISLRMPERGGAEGGTPEVYFTDPDGILIQIQDITYCGGGGYLGNNCLE
ncbi:MAG: VOC family protein [Pseudohongiellaceae bacterium]